jgi:hypothetical protein
MSRYILIRRLRGPAFLLLVGVMALLAQAHILGWSKSWPLFLILAGVLLLAERAVLSMEDAYPGGQYPGAAMNGPGAPPQPATTAIVPAHEPDYGNGHEGGQS